jgi:hypothetical protein
LNTADVTPFRYCSSVFDTSPIVADVAVIASAVISSTLISAYDVPASEKSIVVVGFVVISVINLITPSDASLATAINLRFSDTDADPVAAADVTLALVLANVNVVAVGAPVI